MKLVLKRMISWSLLSWKVAHLNQAKKNQPPKESMIQSSAPFTPSMQKLLPLVSGRQQTAVLTFHTNELFRFNDPFCCENKKVTQIVAKRGKVGMYGKGQTPSQLKMDPNATYRPPETSVFVCVYMWYGNIVCVNKYMWISEWKRERRRKAERARARPPGFILFFSVESEKRGGWEVERGTWYVMWSSLRLDGGGEERWMEEAWNTFYGSRPSVKPGLANRLGQGAAVHCFGSTVKHTPSQKKKKKSTVMNN